MIKYIIGIDPGKSGGVGFYINKNLILKYKCPETVEEMGKLIKDLINPTKIKKTIAYVEQVHAMPHDGRSSLFKFGTNYGQWLGILAALEIKTKLVSPQKWMKYFGEQTKEGRLPKEKKDRKNKLKDMAIELTPTNCGKTTLSTADAFLITIYGKKQEEENEK
tara:strand:- start:5732 stop:6220 length:489 start_codon:yes stop_codon:yes gene_type:complete